MSHELPLLSFVLPARDQCRELTLFIFTLYRHFESRSESFELIVIDDGSKDQTSFVVERLARQFKTISLITHQQPIGLGVAAREGMLKSRGSRIVLLRPNFSLQVLDELLETSRHQSFSGVVFGRISLTSSLWPLALFFLYSWKLFNWFFSLMISGGLSARFSPIVFSRSVGVEVAQAGRIAHGGFQFELIFLASRRRRDVELIPLSRPFFVEALPLFYFLTVTKELLKTFFREWRKRGVVV